MSEPAVQSEEESARQALQLALKRKGKAVINLAGSRAEWKSACAAERTAHDAYEAILQKDEGK